MITKKNLLLSMSMVLAASACALAQENAAANLILDGGFEQGILGWTGWPTFPLARSTEHVHSGKYSLAFPQGEFTQVGGDQRKGMWSCKGMESRPFVGEPGATYRFKAYGFSEKSDVPGKLSLTFGSKILRGSFPNASTEVQADGAWHELGVDFTVPDDLTNGVEVFGVFVGTQGKVWVDDLSLVKIKPAPVKPVGIGWKTKMYFSSKEAIHTVCQLKNQSGAPLKLNFSAVANLPDPGSNIIYYPNDVYRVEKNKWPAQSIALGVGETKEIDLSLEAGAVPNTGMEYVVNVQGEDGKVIAKSRREVLICDRVDWRKQFSVGAQYYERDNGTGNWLNELRDAGVDSVRECVPLPYCYRENIPGMRTDWPIDRRLSYYARMGLKWLSADWTVVGMMPPWLLEDPKNRFTLFDGTVRNIPYASYHIAKVREALYRDAESQAKEVMANPVIAGVQNDNELGVTDDYGVEAQASFRAYVKGEFGDIAKVNAAWGTAYRTWDEVKQPAPIMAEHILQGVTGTDVPQPEPRIPAKDFLWMKWREDCMTAYHRGWTEHFKKGAPEIPVTCNFMLPYWSHPRAYISNPINLFRYAEFYDCGGIDAGAHDMGRTYNQYAFDFLNSAWGNRSVWIPESYYNWNKLDKHTVGFNLFYYMGRKVMHYEFFCWPANPANGSAPGGYSAAPTGARRAEILKDIKTEVGEAKAFDERFKAASLEYIQPQVGVYWSNDIFCFVNAIGKSMDSLPGGDSVYDLDKVLADTHVPVRLVDKERFLNGKETGVRLLFVGGAWVLDRPVTEKLLGYANDGGVLFLNGATGEYDGHMVKMPGALSGKAESLGIVPENWKGGSQIMVVPNRDPMVKLPAGKKVRGIGRYEKTKLSADWKVLLQFEDGSPALVTRPYGKGQILWSLTDVASPYGLYHSAQTRQFMEGLLEYCKVGRPAVAYAGDKPAPDMVLTVQRKSPTEHFVFYNNFGAGGEFKLYLNFPEKGATITDAITGEKIEFKPERDCLAVTLKADHLGYGVLRVESAEVNLADPEVKVIEEVAGDQSSSPAVAKTDVSSASGKPTQCSIREEKAADGSPLVWLDGPFCKVALSPSHGGRVVHLSASGKSANMLLPLKEVYSEGPVSEVSGIKAIVDPKGGTYGDSLVLREKFNVAAKKTDAQGASVKLSVQRVNDADGKTVSVEEEAQVLRDTPGIRWTVRQSHQADVKLRLYAHAPLLLGGEAGRRVQFTVGTPEGLLSAKFKPGDAGRPVPLNGKGKAMWAAISDQESQTTLICVPTKGFTQTSFWNDAFSYNLEVSGEFQDLKAGEIQEGELVFYPCQDLDLVTFVGESLAGTFLSSDEGSPSQNVDLNVCALDGKAREVTLMLAGVSRAADQQERPLGEVQMKVEPLKANARKISLGGSGTGFASYRLYLKTDKGNSLLGEIPNRWKVNEQ